MSRVDEQKKLAVWSKAHIIPGHDPAVWRHDDLGAPFDTVIFNTLHNTDGTCF